MKLADLRKLAIKRQIRIRFPLKNGMDCVMDERGVALVPGLNRVPDFNLEQEVAAAASFVLEPLTLGQKNAPKAKIVQREELAAMISAPAAGAPAHHDEHEDE